MVSMMLSINFHLANDRSLLTSQKLATDLFKNSPLHLASRKGYNGVLSMLLDQPFFNMSVRNSSGLSPAQLPHNRPIYDQETAKRIESNLLQHPELLSGTSLNIQPDYAFIGTTTRIFVLLKVLNDIQAKYAENSDTGAGRPVFD